MTRPIDLAAVAASRARLSALFTAHPGLRVPTLAEVEHMAGYLYTPDQVAFIAQVTPATVRLWLREGRLAGGRLPGRGRPAWRVTEAAVGEFFRGSGLDVPELPAPEEVDRRRGGAGE
jgi:hypothetical protein